MNRQERIERKKRLIANIEIIPELKTKLDELEIKINKIEVNTKK